jgi:hypothetical protein
MKHSQEITAFKLRNDRHRNREQAVIISGGDHNKESVIVKVKRVDREFTTNGLPILNYDAATTAINNLKVINSSESDSEHQSEEPVEGAESLNLNSSVQAQSMSQAK